MSDPATDVASEAATEAATSLAVDAAATLRPQIISVVDAYGLPALFAVVFTYALIHMSKGMVHDLLSNRGHDKTRRNNMVRLATVFPGMLAACVVDVAPIAAALGVKLHWAASIPVGGILYGNGAVLLHWLWSQFKAFRGIEDPPEKEVQDQRYEQQWAKSTGVHMLSDLNPDYTEPDK